MHDGESGDGRDYEVGRGKPPTHSRFPKGVSGHPTGRPKGSLNLKTLHRKVYERRIKLGINGAPETVTALEAIMLTECDLALKGDMRAIKAVQDRQQKYDDGRRLELEEKVRAIIKRARSSRQGVAEFADKPQSR